MTNNILGSLTPARFLREYWQKKPLLIRNAFPHFSGILNKNALITLSSHEEVQSRLVYCDHGQWNVLNGPFKKRDFATIKEHWTLLVQSVNHFYPEAQALINKFNFIPHARLDDLMVSFAPEGGGVGPHIDSYDVFLLQGMGKRLWQISSQNDQRLLPDAPLKILKKFTPEEEWVLNPGDMLYLPPKYAHNGIAVGDCMTYSIGFRSLMHPEIVYEFLAYLQEKITVEGMYTDPDLIATQHPARIPDAMINKVLQVTKNIRFEKSDIKQFLGKYLSAPKSHVFFDSPEVILTKEKFISQAKKSGICLALKSQMLFTDEMGFINGEPFLLSPKNSALLKKLADERGTMLSTTLDACTRDLLYEWYQEGYLDVSDD